MERVVQGLGKFVLGKMKVPKKSVKVFRITVFFFKDFIYLFMRDTERGRDIGRGRSRLPAGSPMRDLIPGPRDHILSQRQSLNC